MKIWSWQKGRQLGCDYYKFTLLLFKIWKFAGDGYILKYSPNVTLPWHDDKIENAKHWRLNIQLFGSSKFIMKKDGKELIVNKRIIFFRPDLYPHFLEVYDKGCIKLSFGFVKYL